MQSERVAHLASAALAVTLLTLSVVRFLHSPEGEIMRRSIAVKWAGFSNGCKPCAQRKYLAKEYLRHLRHVQFDAEQIVTGQDAPTVPDIVPLSEDDS